MAKDIDEGRFCAFLAYILIGIIWYFVDDKMKKNAFAKFHVGQAIVLLIASIIINIVGVVIPFIGWFIILPIGGLLVLIWWLVGVIASLTGNKKELFWIGHLARKFNL